MRLASSCSGKGLNNCPIFESLDARRSGTKIELICAPGLLVVRDTAVDPVKGRHRKYVQCIFERGLLRRLLVEQQMNSI
jgi:hypothetical protein